MSDEQVEPDEAQQKAESGEGAEREPRFEELLGELEQLVERLERGEQSLEQALSDFERGMELTRRSGAILDRAEARVEQLLEQRDGTVREAPFEEGGEGGDASDAERSGGRRAAGAPEGDGTESSGGTDDLPF